MMILEKKWVRATRRENFSPNKHSRLCSKHFKEEDFDRSLSKVRLHSGTIPSIFEAFPHHLKLKETPKRKPPKERQLRYHVPSPGCASENFEIVPEGDVDNGE